MIVNIHVHCTVSPAVLLTGFFGEVLLWRIYFLNNLIVSHEHINSLTYVCNYSRR